jgi:coupling of ubiquitin conjugation to ER degradation protein 1
VLRSQPPPAFYQLYPQPDQPAPAHQPVASPTSKSITSSSANPANLIQKFNLDKEIASPAASLQATATRKAAWLDTPEKRETNLRERKAQMVLAARQ